MGIGGISSPGSELRLFTLQIPCRLGKVQALKRPEQTSLHVKLVLGQKQPMTNELEQINDKNGRPWGEADHQSPGSIRLKFPT